MIGHEGYAIIDGVIDADECALLATRGPGVHGARSLLAAPWCAQLARRLQDAAGLPPSLLAVQCTWFEKSDGHNWLVPLHQDLSIPVAARVEAPGLRGWSIKDGVQFVQAPGEVLAKMVALRLHLDPCGPGDGGLRVVPGSHRLGVLDAQATQNLRAAGGEVDCHLGIGGVLLLHPLLLHASSKSSGSSRRRVLHFLFGPRQLPDGLAWNA